MNKNILLNCIGGGKYTQSQIRNGDTGLQNGFNEVHLMNVNDIDPVFKEKNRKILESPKGGGYWLWKVYFIDRILNKMDESDVLFYCDAGSHFIRNMTPIFDKIRNDEKGIISFLIGGNHLEKYWTKRDLFIHMGLDSSEYKNTRQINGAFMGFRKTEFSLNVIKEYLDLACNFHLISEESSINSNDLEFKDHRHDQSIWSLLTKKYKITIHPEITQWGLVHNECKPEEQYIEHTRDQG